MADQLYARVFVKILDSSLAEDWQVRHVFEDILKLADDGLVDMTHAAIARRTNVPLEIVTRAISILESPDPNSRDPQDDGRRLARLDEHRDWGWRVVNWEKYDAIRTRNDQRERVRQRVERFRSKFKPSNPVQPELPGTQTHTQTHTHTQRVTDVTVTTVTPESIYVHYPRKEAKIKALIAIEKAMEEHDPQMLLEKCRLYGEAVANWPKEELQYVPLPATWFNQGRFLDDPAVWRREKSNELPIWRRIEHLQRAIKVHPANPQFIDHDASKVTPEMRADLNAKREQLRQLENNQV